VVTATLGDHHQKLCGRAALLGNCKALSNVAGTLPLFRVIAYLMQLIAETSRLSEGSFSAPSSSCGFAEQLVDSRRYAAMYGRMRQFARSERVRAEPDVQPSPSDLAKQWDLQIEEIRQSSRGCVAVRDARVRSCGWRSGCRCKNAPGKSGAYTAERDSRSRTLPHQYSRRLESFLLKRTSYKCPRRLPDLRLGLLRRPDANSLVHGVRERRGTSMPLASTSSR